jgi:putative DNA primase/helicase
VKGRALFWRLLGDFLRSSNSQAPGLTFANAGQASACVRLKWCVDLHDSWTVAPILYLDGTMNERLARRWLPRLDVRARIAVKATGGAHRHQVIDWSAAASKTTPGAPGEDEDTQIRNAARIARHIETRAAEHRGQGPSGVDVLVIGTKKLVAYLEKNLRHRFGSRVEMTWQGNIRGVDRWKDVPCLVVIGRLLPWPSEVEEIAGIIFDRVIPPIPPDEKGWAWYLRQPRGIRLRDGRAIAVNGTCHPDPDAEAVRWSICEAELVQAEARVRAIRRTDAAPASIDIIANVCLPLTIDEALRWDDLQPGPVEVAAARGGIPFSWSGLAKLLPDLFETPEAARQYFKNHPEEGEVLRLLKTGQTPISSLPIGVRPLFEIRWTRVHYRLAAGGYSADALVRADVDARVHLERAIGELASFEVRGELDLRPPPVPVHEPRHGLPHPAAGTDLPAERARAVLPEQDPPSPGTDDRIAPVDLVAVLEVARARRASLGSWVEQGVVSELAALDPESVATRARGVRQSAERR